MEVSSQVSISDSKYSKYLQWGKLIFLTGSTQVFIQLTTLGIGIFVIRSLPVEEYAYYTIANTMLGTMTILADGGISSGVMAQGGKVWRDKVRLGQVLSTGMELRKKFAVFSLLVAVPILVYLLWSHGAKPWTIFFITLALVPSFFAALSDSLLEIVPLLHQHIKPLQSNQLIVGLFRLFLSTVSIFCLPFTFIALLANGIPRVYGNVQLKKLASLFADKDEKPDLVVKADILAIVKRRMPEAIYYCVSGQITIWLISIFGNASSIAQIGALGRLSAVLSVFTILSSTLIIPRFARFPNNKNMLIKHFIRIVFLLIVVSIIITSLFYVFPTQFLFVLGAKYSNLSHELTLSIIGSCLGLISGSIFSLSNSRGWVMNPAVSISLNLLTIVAGVLLINVSTIQGILILKIFIGSAQILILFSFFMIKVFKLKDE
jgi:O-antigen/teichoic acid export membrane protein